jgi:hypothetical protein
MRDRRFREIPKVLETPKGKELAEDVENMTTLRGLAEDGGSSAPSLDVKKAAKRRQKDIARPSARST